MENAIVNRVAESSLVTLNLEDFYPATPIEVFDMKDFLFMGLILKEKDFREAMKALDLGRFAGRHVAVTCSADAIIPVWAYMLVAAYLQPVAADIDFADAQTLEQALLMKNIAAMDVSAFADQRVVIKGCGEKPVGAAAYLQITKLLRPVAKSILYGEPCSTVPVFKRK